MPDIFIAKKQKKEAKAKEPGSAVKKKKPFTKKRREGIPDHVHNPLSSFCFRPHSVNFETRDRQEEIVLLLRRHPITNLGWIITFVLMLFAPVVLGSFPFLSFLPGNYQFISVLGWYLVTIAFALEKFLSWFFNVYLVTDERIIDIDFHNLIYKEVSDANIDKIQDVTYKMGGAIRTVFNYGDLVIQTASEMPNFDFSAVPKPARVAKILQDLRIEEEVEKIEGRVR